MKNNNEKKLVTFFESDNEFQRIQSDINSGWNLTNLLCNGKGYVGIMERNSLETDPEVVVIPARKIRFTK